MSENTSLNTDTSRSPAELAMILGSIGMCCVLKIWYSGASVEACRWLLTPTVTLVSWFSGEHYTFTSGLGFLRADGQILINKSCSGLNFLVISFALSCYLQFSQTRSTARQIKGFALCLFWSSALTLLANTARILSASQFAQYERWTSLFVDPKTFHKGLGSFVYLMFLVGFFFILQRGSHGHHKQPST